MCRRSRLFVLVVSAILSEIAAPPPSTRPLCNLYDDSPVGVVCFHGDEVTSAIATGETSWLIEFYSSWCGHCIHFAPTWKELAKNVSGWSSVVKLGVVDCADKGSYSTCSTYDVRGYPTMRFFHPGETDPKAPSKLYRGSRKVSDIKKAILDHVESYSGPPPSHWPHFPPVQGAHLLSISEDEWVPVALVFEEENSYVGKELMLDLLSLKQLQVYRIHSTNLHLVNHYSIMEFPSLVIESKKDDYIVVPGHSLADPRHEFGESIRRYFRNVPQTLPPRRVSISQPPSPAAEVNTQTTPTRYNRVSPTDLLGAISYTLRQEVPLYSIISGTAFTSLLRLVHLLENVFTKAYPVAVPSLALVRERLEIKLSAGFITNRDWVRLLDTKLDEALFPRDPKWQNCRGSRSHFRGYPCALWMLSHALTVISLPVQQKRDPGTTDFGPKMTFGSKEALTITSRFIQNFFSCESCRDHFTEMSRSLGQGRVLNDGDAVLWLWEAHNVVNRRLMNDISSDPLYPKRPFPSLKHCPYCYVQLTSGTKGGAGHNSHPKWSNTGFRSRTESFLSLNTTKVEGSLVYVWNKTALLLYLWNFYHWNSSHSITQKAVLQAAWPQLLTSHQRFTVGVHRGVGFSTYDLGFCVTYYALCGALLLVVGYWLVRKRFRHKRHFLHP